MRRGGQKERQTVPTATKDQPQATNITEIRYGLRVGGGGGCGADRKHTTRRLTPEKHNLEQPSKYVDSRRAIMPEDVCRIQKRFNEQDRQIF
jgi:hypothetical protein